MSRDRSLGAKETTHSRWPRFLPAFALLVSCAKSTADSAPPTQSGAGRVAPHAPANVAQIINNGSKLVMDQITKPTEAMHLSYSGQQNINPKFPQAAGSKPQVGPVQIEADVTPAKLSVATTTAGTRKEAGGDTADKMNVAGARMELVLDLVPTNMLIALGGPAASPAGSENVGAVATDRYDINTATAPPAAQAGIQMAMSMLGGGEKIQSVKGSVWIDKATGRLAKLNLDSQLTDSAGDSWSEHREMVVTAQ